MIFLLRALAFCASLTLCSCVELAALAFLMEQEKVDTPDLPPLNMVDGPQGRHALGYSAKGLSAAVINPYSGKAVAVTGKAPYDLIRSDGKRFYIPNIEKYPTASLVTGTKNTFINPFDNRHVTIGGYKPGTLVSSPTAGTFFYLAPQY